MTEMEDPVHFLSLLAILVIVPLKRFPGNLSFGKLFNFDGKACVSLKVKHLQDKYNLGQV